VRWRLFKTAILSIVAPGTVGVLGLPQPASVLAGVLEALPVLRLQKPALRHSLWRAPVHDKRALGSLHCQAMRFDLITIFPEFFAGPLDHGIVRRAREAGITEIHVQDLREFTKDRHRTVDDRPFGGGEGMVLKPEPLFEAVEKLLERSVGDSEAKIPPSGNTAIVLMSAAGRLFTQETARRFAKIDRLVLICGRYEGVDERVAEHLATDEISIGDFVLSGGELPAALIVDAVTRLLPGAVGNEASTQNESFQEYVGAPSAPDRARSVLLDFPHYTRPAEYRGWKVPDVLIGGNHAEVAKWRRHMAIEKTRRNRPDLRAGVDAR
jgi:tRNA (guanine37-N1)-methyltransferase